MDTTTFLKVLVIILVFRRRFNPDLHWICFWRRSYGVYVYARYTQKRLALCFITEVKNFLVLIEPVKPFEQILTTCHVQ